MLDKQNSSNQPNQSQSQSVIDQGNLISRKTFKGETSRSQEISLKSFHEELCFSDRSRQLDRTQNVISVHTCPYEENKNVRVEQTHDRSRQLDKHTVAVYKTTVKYFMRPKRSTPTIRHFMKELRETETSKFQDYHILL